MHWTNRRKLLWKFIKANSKARELELEIQAVEQKMRDIGFANDLNPASKEKELAYHKGYRDGVIFVMDRFK